MPGSCCVIPVVFNGTPQVTAVPNAVPIFTAEVASDATFVDTVASVPTETVQPVIEQADALVQPVQVLNNAITSVVQQTVDPILAVVIPGSFGPGGDLNEPSVETYAQRNLSQWRQLANATGWLSNVGPQNGWLVNALHTIAWATSTTYVVGDRVSHPSDVAWARPECILTTLGISDAITEPHVGSSWQTYWEEIVQTTIPLVNLFVPREQLASGGMIRIRAQGTHDSFGNDGGSFAIAFTTSRTWAGGGVFALLQLNSGWKPGTPPASELGLWDLDATIFATDQDGAFVKARIEFGQDGEVESYIADIDVAAYSADMDGQILAGSRPRTPAGDGFRGQSFRIAVSDGVLDWTGDVDVYVYMLATGLRSTATCRWIQGAQLGSQSGWET